MVVCIRGNCHSCQSYELRKRPVYCTRAELVHYMHRSVYYTCCIHDTLYILSLISLCRITRSNAFPQRVRLTLLRCYVPVALVRNSVFNILHFAQVVAELRRIYATLWPQYWHGLLLYSLNRRLAFESWLSELLKRDTLQNSNNNFNL